MTDPKIDRSQTRFQAEKTDVERLLGEARKDMMSEPGTSPERIRANGKLIDALSVLENMVEGEVLSIRKNDDMYWLYGPGFAINLDVEKRGPIVADAIHMVAQEPPTEEWKCIQCGSVQPATNERCKDCGQKRPETTEARVMKPAPTREPYTREQQLSQDLEPPEEPLPKMAGFKCGSCGADAMIDQGEYFCPECGAVAEEPEKEGEWPKNNCRHCGSMMSQEGKCLNPNCGANMEDKQ